MPWESGKFTRTTSWVQEAADGIKILASNHDSEDNNFRDGIDSCLHKGGGNAPTSNLNMAGFKITNLLAPTPGSQDAATAKWVETMEGWTSAKAISGANVDGRLNFSADTGVNGIGWKGADVSWVAKLAEANKTSHRLVMNNKYDASDPTSTDVFIIDDEGRANYSMHFDSYDAWE